ncbi:MAG: magnesium transporter, partial [Thiotrichales bacterium]
MPNLEHQSSEQRLEALHEAMETGSLSRVKRMLNAMHPAEIADLIEASPRGQRELIWEMTDPDNEGEVLIELSDDVRGSLIEEMDTGEILSTIKDLDYDDMADFLQSLPDALITQTLAGMDRQNRIRLEAVLAYDEDTAGGMMDTQTITVRADVSLDVVLRYLRRQESLPSHTDNIIVVNRYDRYLGILPLSTALTSQPETLVVDVMETKQQPIQADTASQQVARLFEDRNLISAPVVDENNKLLGRITIDDVVDVIREEAEHSVMSMAGLDDEEDLFAPVVISARR